MVDYTTITLRSSSFNLSHKVLHLAHDIEFSWICHKIQWQLMQIIFTYQDFIQLSALYQVIKPWHSTSFPQGSINTSCVTSHLYSTYILASINFTSSWSWSWIPFKSQLNFHVLPIKSNDIIHTVKFSFFISLFIICWRLALPTDSHPSIFHILNDIPDRFKSALNFHVKT